MRAFGKMNEGGKPWKCNKCHRCCLWEWSYFCIFQEKYSIYQFKMYCLMTKWIASYCHHWLITTADNVVVTEFFLLATQLDLKNWWKLKILISFFTKHSINVAPGFTIKYLKVSIHQWTRQWQCHHNSLLLLPSISKLLLWLLHPGLLVLHPPHQQTTYPWFLSQPLGPPPPPLTVSQLLASPLLWRFAYPLPPQVARWRGKEFQTCHGTSERGGRLTLIPCMRPKTRTKTV